MKLVSSRDTSLLTQVFLQMSIPSPNHIGSDRFVLLSVSDPGISAYVYLGDRTHAWTQNKSIHFICTICTSP